MKYMLDTNILIYALNNKYPKVGKQILKKSPSEIAIPSIVMAELYLGAEKSRSRDRVYEAVKNLLTPFQIRPFGEKEAVNYARIRALMEKKGTLIGPNDLIIAATTLANGCILVTNNTREFDLVEGLNLENWTQ
jgi:tRNA(fMet)-specific endonuclease VapC